MENKNKDEYRYDPVLDSKPVAIGKEQVSEICRYLMGRLPVENIGYIPNCNGLVIFKLEPSDGFRFEHIKVAVDELNNLQEKYGDFDFEVEVMDESIVGSYDKSEVEIAMVNKFPGDVADKITEDIEVVFGKMRDYLVDEVYDRFKGKPDTTITKEDIGQILDIYNYELGGYLTYFTTIATQVAGNVARMSCKIEKKEK